MPAPAVALVLSAAVIHATWNLLAKRAGAGGSTFVWLQSTVGSFLYAPIGIALVLRHDPPLGSVELGYLVGSGLLHVAYNVCLQHGYTKGDLSVVYPAARGSGPVLAAVGGVLLLGERPTALAIAGIVLVGSSIFALIPRNRLTHGIRWGLTTGVAIGAYSVWDAHLVSNILIAPLLIAWTSCLSSSVLLTPHVLRRKNTVEPIWTAHWREAVGVGLLSPLAYLLVLAAFALAPVSYVAPAREISIVVAAIMGAHILSEKDGARRIVVSIGVAVGVVALVVG